VDSMDQKKSIYEYVVEWGQCPRGGGAWPDHCRSKAPDLVVGGGRYTPDDQVLDRCASRDAKAQKEENAIAASKAG